MKCQSTIDLTIIHTLFTNKVLSIKFFTVTVVVWNFCDLGNFDFYNIDLCH